MAGKKNNATSSWSGYNHQGQVGIFLALKELNELLQKDKELEELYPGENIICDPLSLSVSCHIGPHSLAIAICKKI